MRSKRWELHAAYGGLGTREISNIMSDPALDPVTRAGLLSAALATRFKEVARSEYVSLVAPPQGKPEFETRGIEPALRWMEKLGLDRMSDDTLSHLPRYASLLSFSFRLTKPYLSQDDDAFYIIENPVRKDKVFKVPSVAPTGWKGSLRSAATFALVRRLKPMMPDKPLEEILAERARNVLLFGNEKADEAYFLNKIIGQAYGQESEKEWGAIGDQFSKYLEERGYLAEKVEGRQGRLFFFPTFLDRIGLEIINPHLRDSRVGKNPIQFECVPAGGQGWFRLLWVPFDLVGDGQDAARRQLREDLPIIAEAVQDALTGYGFGAKTSSGYGVADPGSATGVWRINYIVEKEVKAEEESASEVWVRQVTAGTDQEYLLHDAFFTGGRMPILRDNSKVKAQPWGGKAKADYKKVRDWLLPKLEERPTGPRLLEQPVTDLTTLKNVAQALADTLVAKEGQE